jgi:hypothetical protein
MPKIAMRYVGDDKKEIARLAAQGGIKFFEPIDAREVIESGNPDYEIDEEHAKQIGATIGADGEYNIPNLHMGDDELQTGLSASKYGRNQVVQAGLDGTAPTASRPATTRGVPLNEGDPEAGHQKGAQPDAADPAAEATTRSPRKRVRH